MIALNLNLILIFFALIFFIGILGIILFSRNFIQFLVYMELIYLNISFLFVVISSYVLNSIGELFSFFILSIAAAEAAIGFALIVLILNKAGTILLKDFHHFQG